MMILTGAENYPPEGGGKSANLGAPGLVIWQLCLKLGV